MLALCCVGGGIAVASTTLAPWAESDRDAARSRYNSAETTLGPSNVAQVTHLRRFSTPSPGPYGTCSQGAAQSILTAGRVFFVGDTGAYAYNAQTGALIWHQAISGSDSIRYHDIAASAGRVFVGLDDCDSNSDPNGGILVFNASNGAELWAGGVGLGTELDGLVVSGSYVVASGASMGSGARVAVYDAATGAVAWSRTYDYACFRNPAIVVRSRVIYSTCDANGYAVLQAADLATGTVSWTKLGDWGAVRGDSDASTAHHLYAKSIPGRSNVDINPATGATRFTLAGAHNVLAVGPARVFASCATGICSYATATGAPSWSASGAAPVALANGVLYTAYGKARNATTGALIATINFGGGANQLLVGDGRIGVVSDPHAFDLYGLPGD